LSLLVARTPIIELTAFARVSENVVVENVFPNREYYISNTNHPGIL
jgi:hypothetical protein